MKSNLILAALLVASVHSFQFGGTSEEDSQGSFDKSFSAAPAAGAVCKPAAQGEVCSVEIPTAPKASKVKWFRPGMQFVPADAAVVGVVYRLLGTRAFEAFGFDYARNVELFHLAGEKGDLYVFLEAAETQTLALAGLQGADGGTGVPYFVSSIAITSDPDPVDPGGIPTAFWRTGYTQYAYANLTK
jgi:hypothetical protein